MRSILKNAAIADRSMTIRPSPVPAPAAAWQASFLDHYHRLVRFAGRRTGDPQEARDLVHDAWLRLAETSAPAAGDTLPQSYLFAVAEHLALDDLRRRQRRRTRFVASEDAPEHLAAPAPDDVARRHEHRQALHAVVQAIEALPERCRAIFLADRLDGTPQAEIAARHGVSVKTVEREIMCAMDGVEAALRRWRGEAAVPRRGRRRVLSALLGTAALTPCGLILWQAWREQAARYATALSSPRGQLTTAQLPDGSTVTLDADSRATVDYDARGRTVRLLAGGAFFAVAHDASRPFRVLAGGHTVRVLGTRFEVALVPGDGLLLAVEAGRVELLSTRGETRVLTAGQRLRIDAAQRLSATEAGVSGDVAAWRGGWLDLRESTLGEAVARLARYSRRPLSVDPRVAELRVLGRVRIAEADAWLRLLPRSLPVLVRDDGAGGLVVVPRA